MRSVRNNNFPTLYIVQTRGAFRNLKGQSQLCDRADLDTGFLTLKKGLPQPKIKVQPRIHYIFRGVLLDFQSCTEKPVFQCPVCHLWYFLIISGKRQHLSRLCYMQISYGMVCNAHVRRLLSPAEDFRITAVTSSWSLLQILFYWSIPLRAIDRFRDPFSGFSGHLKEIFLIMMLNYRLI